MSAAASGKQFFSTKSFELLNLPSAVCFSWYISYEIDRLPGNITNVEITPAQWVDKIYPTLSRAELDILGECTLEPGVLKEERGEGV